MGAVIDLRGIHNGRAVLSFDYDAEANASLKRYEKARWSPEAKTWWCSTHRPEAAYQALTDLGYRVVVMRDEERIVTKTVATATDPFDALREESVAMHRGD